MRKKPRLFQGMILGGWFFRHRGGVARIKAKVREFQDPERKGAHSERTIRIKMAVVGIETASRALGVSLGMDLCLQTGKKRRKPKSK